MGARGPLPDRKKYAISASTAGGIKVKQLPDEAAALFKRVVRDLPTATPADAAVIEQMCQAVLLARWAFEELAQVDADGRRNLLEQDTAHGSGQEMRRHPMWIAWRTAAEQLRAAAQQLGATPMARARLPEPEAEQMSLADLLFAEVQQDA